MLIDQLFSKPSLNGAISGIVSKKDKLMSIVGFNSNRNKSWFPLVNGPIAFTFHEKKSYVFKKQHCINYSASVSGGKWGILH